MIKRNQPILNGTLIKLKEKMYHSPYSPWYDDHLDKTWIVVDGNSNDGHVLCMNSSNEKEQYAFHFHEIEIIVQNK
jgi:hypothetical protein